MTAGEALMAVLVGYLVLRRTAAAALVDGWVWPVPSWNAVLPQISQGFRPGHPGVDILFRVRGRWVAPEGVPIVAANAGEVQRVMRSPRGMSVVIGHGNDVVSYYQHLETSTVVQGQRVAAGDELGTMGIDPLDLQQVRHLHFQIWQRVGGRVVQIDPADDMRRWRVLPWTM